MLEEKSSFELCWIKLRSAFYSFNLCKLHVIRSHSYFSENESLLVIRDPCLFCDPYVIPYVGAAVRFNEGYTYCVRVDSLLVLVALQGSLENTMRMSLTGPRSMRYLQPFP